MRIGLIGCGSIGSAVAQAIADGRIPGVELIAIADVVETETAKRVAAAAGCPFFTDDRLLLELRPDLVVEAASQEAVRTWAGEVLESGADLLIVSVGALAAPEVFSRLTDLARRHGRRIHVPSGAIGGVDVIKGAAVGGIEECRLTTTKPPRALASAPYVREHRIDLEGIGKATLIYEGPASQAVCYFPQNVNVAATIGLAGIGLDKTTVRIVADPGAARNVHEVFVRGAFGEATIRLENMPSPANPKSSYLTSLSVIAALQSLSREFQLGT
jgi:aspartate dehydrogenase